MSLQQQRKPTATNVTTHVILTKNRSTKLLKWRGGGQEEIICYTRIWCLPQRMASSRASCVRVSPVVDKHTLQTVVKLSL